MVAYKKLTKDERQTISRRMETLRRRKEIDERVEKISKEIEDALWNEVPTEVKDLYDKYPQYVNAREYNMYGYNFLEVTNWIVISDIILHLHLNCQNF